MPLFIAWAVTIVIVYFAIFGLSFTASIHEFTMRQRFLYSLLILGIMVAAVLLSLGVIFGMSALWTWALA